MNNYLENCNKDILKVIKRIARIADREDVKVYIVGGIVRDMILGRDNLDLDILVDPDAILFAKKVGKEYGVKVKTFEKFFTANLVLPGGLVVDFASARKEKYLKPGALPSVKRGSLNDDLLRTTAF